MHTQIINTTENSNLLKTTQKCIVRLHTEYSNHYSNISKVSWIQKLTYHYMV